ncbi:heme uptake protein IsdC [Paenibacillus sp. y28]|uniref:heme uptake protein IsdC n=1 Tax=Paenibacillus sp. y28 TaxID=3129110 RepID=UPI00301774A8
MRIKKLVPSFVLLLFLLMAFMMPSAFAADTLSDGTYTLNYTVLKAENDSVSMANDYWEKPARIVVKNGEMTMQMRVNHSKWVTVFKVESNGGFVDTKVIGTDEAEDTRDVEFGIKDISRPLVSKIHVTVKDIEYDHDYTIRFNFDTKSLKPISGGAAGQPAAASAPANTASEKASALSPAAKQANSSAAPAAKSNAAPAADAKAKPEASAGSAAAVSNPQTGDTAPITGLIVLGLASLFFLVRKYKPLNR